MGSNFMGPQPSPAAPQMTRDPVTGQAIWGMPSPAPAGPLGGGGDPRMSNAQMAAPNMGVGQGLYDQQRASLMQQPPQQQLQQQQQPRMAPSMGGWGGGGYPGRGMGGGMGRGGFGGGGGYGQFIDPRMQFQSQQQMMPAMQRSKPSWGGGGWGGWGSGGSGNGNPGMAMRSHARQYNPNQAPTMSNPGPSGWSGSSQTGQSPMSEPDQASTPRQRPSYGDGQVY